MSTNIFDAKSAILDRLRYLAGVVGHPLEGVQVAYAYPGQHMKRECVYGGFATFEQDEDDEATDGLDIISGEAALLTFHIQVQRQLAELAEAPESGEVATGMLVAVCDQRVGQILRGIRLGLREQNALPDWLANARIERGNADYWLTDTDVGSRLACQIGVQSQVSGR